MGTERSESSLEKAIALVTAQLEKEQRSLVVMVGPTASGKTALALALTNQFEIEIVSADSRLIYRGMDIGTAKPTSEERHQCIHHLIDIVDPNESFSVADFQVKAIKIINDILKRGKTPLLVGGTMLYVDAIVYNYQWPEEIKDDELKAKWRGKELVELQSIANQLRPDMDQWIDTKNPVRLQRVLMYHEATGMWLWEVQRMGAELWPHLVLGLNPSKEVLVERITARVMKQWDDGLVNEVKELLKKYPPDTESFAAIGYRQIIEFLADRCTEKEAQDQVIKDTIAYAKRQMTWWKRSKEIVWL